eukprot:COSAG01_NODE_22804_length_840_cov_2.909582_1_plen_144_part_10
MPWHGMAGSSMHDASAARRESGMRPCQPWLAAAGCMAAHVAAASQGAAAQAFKKACGDPKARRGLLHTPCFRWLACAVCNNYAFRDCHGWDGAWDPTHGKTQLLWCATCELSCWGARPHPFGRDMPGGAAAPIHRPISIDTPSP